MTNASARAISWARSHQFNLTFMCAALLFSYMSRKFWPIMLLVIFQSWYWVPAQAYPKRLRNLFEHLRKKLAAVWGKLHWQPLCSWLLVAAAILFFSHWAPLVQFGDIKFGKPYERWEIAALTWNLIFSFISYWITPTFKSALCRLAYYATVLLGLLFTVLAINSLAKLDYYRPDYTNHLTLLLFVAICYAGADIFACLDNVPEKTKFLHIFLYADLPTFVALIVLRLLFDPKTTNAFLSGAIAFQFIANSLIFALIEGGVFKAFVAHPKAEESPKNVEEELKNVEKKWAQTITDKKIDDFMTFLRDEVNMWLDYKWLSDKDSIKREWEERLKGNNFSLRWEASSIEMSTDGSMGYTRGTYHYEMNSTRFSGNYATVWQKSRDGEWQVIASMALSLQRQARSAAVAGN